MQAKKFHRAIAGDTEELQSTRARQWQSIARRLLCSARSFGIFVNICRTSGWHAGLAAPRH
jgi:hypothetical protein